MGATVYWYALSIFIIPVSSRFVKGQTGFFACFLAWQLLVKYAITTLGHTENGRRLIHAPRRECMCMELDVIVKLISIVCDVFKAYLAYLNFKNKQK